MESLEPMNNPILQGPDMPGITVLTRGDKLVLKGVLNEFQKAPFLVKKRLAIDESLSLMSNENADVRKGELKRNKRKKQKNFDDNNAIDDHGYSRKKIDDSKLSTGGKVPELSSNSGRNGEKSKTKNVTRVSGANACKWQRKGVLSRAGFQTVVLGKGIVL